MKPIKSIAAPDMILAMILAIALVSSVYFPARAQEDNANNSSPNTTQPNNQVVKWFSLYDLIRRHAQMSPSERQRADYLLSRGMAILMPGPEKDEARDLLNDLVDKYQLATDHLKQLPLIPETKELHRGYYQYFNNAHILFSDYLHVQDNLLVQDTSGQPLAGQLVQRKQLLEELNQRNQNLDAELRNQYGIAPYKY